MEDRSWTEINLNNFEFNLQELKSFIPENTSLMQIVKADAYGHGALEISKIALKMGATLLGVANAEEGSLLRYQGISAPILILSPSLVSEIPAIIENDLLCTISDLVFAEALNREAIKKKKVVAVHIKIDTGMHRSGFALKDTEKIFDAISFMEGLSINGIFSHFAASESDPEFTMKQASDFVNALMSLPKRPEYVHIANSAAVLSYNIPYMNLVRLGLMSYGIYPSPSYKEKIELKPVMQFKTKISLIKYVRKGESVGYNRIFVAKSDIKVAILPVGYADGYDFQLSNRGYALIKTVLCPIIGKISMDMTAVDISRIYQISVGEEAVLLGGDEEELHAESLASLYDGNSYELLCQIGRRAKRY
ncbi:MAG TPA: alanine racemase, partial [Candidatus Cloacimonadota bacterium]|nr:alanine racemase [Candidatus Cloacimonadota bacterium]